MQRHSFKLRGRRAAVAAVGLALLVAGCGQSSSNRARPERQAAGPQKAGQPAATDLVYTADPARGQVQVVGAHGQVLRTLPAGVPSPDWRTLYVAAGGADRTTVRAMDVASGRELRSITIAGRFRLPVVGTAGIPDGLSGDGQTLALTNIADTPVSRFALLGTDFSKPPELVDLAGDFEFDALSPDGARLFVVEHLAGPDRSAYRVRFYDRGAGKLDPNVIVDKRDAWETSMAGYPNTRVVGPGGEWVFTLYRNTDHGPFVHALNARDGYAFCIDLPKGRDGDDQTARLWTLVRDQTGSRLYAVNNALGLVSEIDGEQFTVLRTASFTPQRPAGGAPALPGSVALGGDGDVLLVGGAAGVTAIGTASLKVERRDLAGWAVDGLVASADGRRVYALSHARGRVAAIDPVSGNVLGERPAPTATLLLHTTGA
jgi:DNA-binding beta-propeller fold protein YncE